MKALGDAELEIMEVLWSVDEPVTVSYISEHLTTRSGWALSTVLTVLSRLADKKLVSCDKSKRRNHYQAILTEKEYKTSQTKQLVGRLYHNSLSKMVANWLEDENISNEDLSELKQIVNRIEGK